MKVRNILLPAVLVVTATLTGCAAVRYEPTSYDSPKPVEAGVPGCLSAGALAAPGDECLALVRADQWWSDTGVTVKKQAAYRLTVPPHQVWFDKGIVNKPPYGDPGNRLMNLFESYKRHEGGLWFSLIAAVVERGPGLDRREYQSVDIGAAIKKECEECDSVIFVAKEDGALSLYPNDAKGPASHPTFFYENNSGQIWVRVRWLTDKEKEASAATETGVADGCRPRTKPTVAQ
ncbi:MULTISPECIES: hypothetical protein [unclassified Polaromonas]|jgi:hypothetical protein|uniref:hypothetical protein n=1 Tax=unclassified Polaromonas TaxID=2638319 RepID=UPI000BD9F5E4|nr:MULTISPECIES: hypothetical protein [unclassified Polaromonas]OYY35298.1 MAG: hypothetical protein B7Y60_13320 [Polaromonas sp. 35-63-35]OYZ19096.1 MAG: hypothetical protein B7Y28_13955 [Polaromonas sp. 16-63-31]OYZ78195.1 MAG: hypothetical protein B7Y09_13735 [Polaromonas sp. 24-63-21]OZA48753.1 MAG: hypothetical protein B7X88_17595 [Polaromonas sp. 17-63-33]OZA87640.1 MAG: hypothetical protein B7X65_12160 [Polaromonas sp. 39-63-25]